MTRPTMFPSGEELLEQLRVFYAESIQCPVEAITDDTDLEADLGVDSLTQIELLDTALERYGLSGQNIRAGAYPTLPDLVKLIQRLHES
jgi:[acyl-carrier-protein] S-malonyltransferase